jgi:Transposase DDE domain.
MDITTFMIAVFCLIEDFLSGKRLRTRGPQPTLCDSEVLTMEVVGEFLGIDTESKIFTHFCRYYADWFPGLRKITRTTFTRQAANLWKIKQELWHMIAQNIDQDPYISIVDSFPVPVCRFARAPRCRSFGEVAAYGHDEVARQTYYGLRAHVRLAWPGVIVDCALAPANIHDTEGAEELLQGVSGFALADRNYWKPELMQRLKTEGLQLLAPYKSAKRQKQPYPRFLTHMRYRIETVFGQLVERFHAKRVWARDLWHLTSRWMRKFLSHTLAVFFCAQENLPYLSFAKLVTH